MATDLSYAFERTTCACPECVACCTEQPGPLAPGELDYIAAYLGVSVRDALPYFWASPGAVVQDSHTGAVHRIGTITPRLRDGRCVFLTEADRCSIHAVAPFGCAYADTHMAEQEWQPRALWLYRTIAADAEYQSLRKMLPAATSWRPRTGRAG